MNMTTQDQPLTLSVVESTSRGHHPNIDEATDCTFDFYLSIHHISVGQEHLKHTATSCQQLKTNPQLSKTCMIIHTRTRIQTKQKQNTHTYNQPTKPVTMTIWQFTTSHLQRICLRWTCWPWTLRPGHHSCAVRLRWGIRPVPHPALLDTCWW